MMKHLHAYFVLGVIIQLQAQDVMTANKTNPSKTSDFRATKVEPMMNDTTEKLILAEQKTKELFKVVADRGLIVPGKSESELTAEIVSIAKEEFGMVDHWHKKIVRAGVNTMESYSKNPSDRIIQKD